MSAPTNGPIDIVMDRGRSGFDDPGYRSRCPGYVNELLEEVDRLAQRVTRLQAREQRMESFANAVKDFDFAASTLLGESPFARERGWTDDGSVSTQWLRSHRDALRVAEAAWALDPLADHRRG